MIENELGNELEDELGHKFEHICEYGCGQEGKYQMGNGKWCCSDHYSKCPFLRNKSSEGSKGRIQPKAIKIENKENKLCDYGCNTKANYQFKNKKICCSESRNMCLGMKKKNSNGTKNNIRPKPEYIENTENKLCDYGCGEKANYKLNNKKLCCKEDWKSCKGLRKPIRIENKENKLCDYGCNTKAHYKFGNGKLCCNERFNSCLGTRKKMSENSIGKSYTKAIKIENKENKLCDYGCGLRAEYKSVSGILCCSESFHSCQICIKNSIKSHENTVMPKAIKIENKENKLCDYGCGLRAHYQLKNKKLCCSESWNSCKESIKKKSECMSFSLKDWQEKYPFFAKIEELREDPITGEIQGHCKNHNCKNSREKGGWFTLNKGQLYQRIMCLEHPLGNDGSYFYCCDECKQQCPLYHLYRDPYVKTNYPYTQEEYNIWRQEVLTRQFDELGHNECEICGNKNLKELQVHHEIPTKKNWIFSLDPDNGIILCVKKERQKEEETCHFKYGHKTGTECSTGNLSNIC